MWRNRFGNPRRVADWKNDLEQVRQEAFVGTAFGPEPEDTDPGGADLTDPAAIPPGAHRSTQTKYGVGVNRCGVLGCGTNTTGLVCSVCTAAGRLPDNVDVYVAPGLERILPDPPLGYPPRTSFGGSRPSSWLTEVLVDDDWDDLPTLDECGPDATALVVYPGGDAA